MSLDWERRFFFRNCSGRGSYWFLWDQVPVDDFVFPVTLSKPIVAFLKVAVVKLRIGSVAVQEKEK